MNAYARAQADIVEELTSTMSLVSPEEVEQLLSVITGSQRVFFVGVGRVMLSLQAIAKRLAHLGIDTVVVGQITEPAITADDALIVGSGSGESAVPLAIAERARQHGATVVHIGSNPESSMRAYAQYFVRIPVQTKLGLDGEVASKQPMTSLFEQSLLLLGDALALTIVRRNEIDMHSLWRHHANLE